MQVPRAEHLRSHHTGKSQPVLRGEYSIIQNARSMKDTSQWRHLSCDFSQRGLDVFVPRHIAKPHNRLHSQGVEAMQHLAYLIIWFTPAHQGQMARTMVDKPLRDES